MNRKGTLKAMLTDLDQRRDRGEISRAEHASLAGYLNSRLTSAR